jgi:hypothetical protein
MLCHTLTIKYTCYGHPFRQVNKCMVYHCKPVSWKFSSVDFASKPKGLSSAPRTVVHLLCDIYGIWLGKVAQGNLWCNNQGGHVSEQVESDGRCPLGYLYGEAGS